VSETVHGSDYRLYWDRACTIAVVTVTLLEYLTLTDIMLYIHKENLIPLHNSCDASLCATHLTYLLRQYQIDTSCSGHVKSWCLYKQVIFIPCFHSGIIGEAGLEPTILWD